MLLKNLPSIVTWLLEHMLDPLVRYSAMGDFEERFHNLLNQKGRIRANIFLWKQIIFLFPAFLKNLIYWSIEMFKNYIKTGFRNFRNHKSFAIINISGLAVGLTCCLLILLFVKNELSYDRFHKNSGNIYRVIMDQRWNPLNGRTFFNITPGGFGPAVKQDFPEVLLSARMQSRSALVNLRDLSFNENLYYVDPDFLEIFTFPLVSGNPKTCLNAPFSILITEEMKLRYFGKEDPIGKVLNINKEHDYVVTGVLKNIPINSHLQFNFLASIQTLYALLGKDRMEIWNSNSFHSYILLADNYDYHQLQDKFPDFRKKYKGDFGAELEDFVLQPLTSIQLYSSHIHDRGRGDIKHIYFLSTIAFLIMLIACFNFMNLSTARTSTRIKEVGLRKVIGAGRKNLVWQFLGESISFSMLSFCLALGLVWLLLPTFNSFVQRELSFSMLFQTQFLIIAAVFVFLIGVISGIYPAFYLSSFQPSGILQGRVKSGSMSSSRLRNSLVIFQFALSGILIICTLIVGRQLEFMRNKDLGFDQEEILNVYIQDPGLRTSYEPLKTALLQNPDITDILVANTLPTTIQSNSVFENPAWAGPGAAKMFYVNWAWVDYDFIDFYGLEIVKGRSFSRELSTDKKTYVINETAARIIGWEDPINKVLKDYPVIGVIKDFHFSPLRQEIEPLALLLMEPGDVRYFSMKIKTGEMDKTLASIEDTWKQFSPGYPFRFSFLDEHLNLMYQSETRLLNIFSHFSLLAVFLSALGLFGLALFTAARKTKEIGIRKVLGANISQIFYLLSKEFIRWVLLANLIAWPVAFYVMDRWLDGFAYKAKFSILIFAAAGLLTFALAMLTVTYQSLRAALANPVDSLRYE